ncbi:MAG: exo-alpha-sialidase, partial [Thermoplasmata archaeon]|nr:exo-alpha-sialidase [Thermoplasmata archaeon]
MNTYGRKIFACFLTIMMICSSLALINTASAQEPVEAPMEVDNPVPDIQVTELRASEPVIYADLNNRLTLSVANYGSANAIKVVADVIDIKPDMSEELIKTLHFGALIVDVERTRFIDWCPEELGTHYVKININYEYLSHHSPAELIENPPVILSVGFPVSPLVDIEYWGPDPWDDASNIITSAEGTRTVDGLIEIRVRNGDLQIETGASLILNQDVTLVMIEPDRGVYDIIVDQDATFEINGGATKTTKLQSSDWQFTYAFFNNGTVDFTGATVWYTYGDKTALNNPGGIQNLPGSTCIIDNCDLLEADTHSLSIEGTADVHVKGVGTTIGRLSGEENPNVVQGHGIFVKEATPVIEYVTVQYNKMDGIHIEDSASEGAPLATCMKYYSSSSYDYRLTDDPDTSTQPIVAAGNGAVYMVYLNQESDIIYFKKSIDKGASWSAPEIVIDSGYPISDIDFAADGDNLALVWVEWPHMFPRTYMVFSEFGGASWTAPPYLLEGAAFCGSSTPAVDVQGSDVFIVYMHWAATGPDFYLTMRVTWSEGIGFEEIIFRSPITGSEFAGIPDIAVEGSDIHVVIADTDSRWPYIYYWQSGDGGISWSDSEPIATYDGSMLPGYISMEATADRVYFAWATYDGGVGNYEIYGMYAYYDGMDWIWSS